MATSPSTRSTDRGSAASAAVGVGARLCAPAPAAARPQSTPRPRLLCAPPARQRCGWSAGHSRAPGRRPALRLAGRQKSELIMRRWRSFASGDGCCGIVPNVRRTSFLARLISGFEGDTGNPGTPSPAARGAPGTARPTHFRENGGGRCQGLRVLCASARASRPPFHARVSGSRDWPESQGVIQPIIYRAGWNRWWDHERHETHERGRRRTGWLHGLEPRGRSKAPEAWRTPEAGATSRAHRRPGGVSPHLGGHPWASQAVLGG